MKRVAAGLLILLLLWTQFCVLALRVLDDGLSFYCDEADFEVFFADRAAPEDGMVFGMTETDFKAYMESRHMVFYGAQKEGKMLFHLTKNKTDFSINVQTFAGMEEKELLKLCEKLSSHPGRVVTVGETPYLYVAFVDSSSNTAFYVQQYITVHQGILYVMTFNTPGETLSEADAQTTESLVQGLTFFTPKKQVSATYLWTCVLLVVLGIVLVAVIVQVTLSLMKDSRRHAKQDTDEA